MSRDSSGWSYGCFWEALAGWKSTQATLPRPTSALLLEYINVYSSLQTMSTDISRSSFGTRVDIHLRTIMISWLTCLLPTREPNDCDGGRGAAGFLHCYIRSWNILAQSTDWISITHGWSWVGRAHTPNCIGRWIQTLRAPPAWIQVLVCSDPFWRSTIGSRRTTSCLSIYSKRFIFLSISSAVFFVLDAYSVDPGILLIQDS